LGESSAYTILPCLLASSRFPQIGKELEITGNRILGAAEFYKVVSCFLPLTADILCPLATIFSVSLSVHVIFYLRSAILKTCKRAIRWISLYNNKCKDLMRRKTGYEF
jgi:hypothetical protein